jgi:hypothetical protein
MNNKNNELSYTSNVYTYAPGLVESNYEIDKEGNYVGVSGNPYYKLCYVIENEDIFELSLMELPTLVEIDTNLQYSSFNSSNFTEFELKNEKYIIDDNKLIYSRGNSMDPIPQKYYYVLFKNCKNLTKITNIIYRELNNIKFNWIKPYVFHFVNCKNFTFDKFEVEAEKDILTNYLSLKNNYYCCVYYKYEDIAIIKQIDNHKLLYEEVQELKDKIKILTDKIYKLQNPVEQNTMYSF